MLVRNPEEARTVDCLKYRFPVGYEGPVPTPAASNHALAVHHPRDMAAYITKEVSELGPYNAPSFIPWCQVNAFLTRPKKDSQLCQVVMNLSWPHPLDVSVNVSAPRDVFRGSHKKMHLPTTANMIRLIQQVGKGSYLYSYIAQAYWQLPLEPCDWPLFCLKPQGHVFINVSLPFSLR